MKQQICFFLFLIALAVGLISGTRQVASNGAPLGSTGAPSEESCARVGCHVGQGGANNLNTGQGVLNISADGDIANYIPGQTYNVTVSIAQSGIERFGFSLLALNEQQLSMGTLHVTDSARTQILEGVLQYAGKDYMTYTFAGSYPDQVGTASWTFQWQAPAQNQGHVTFYAAAVAADNDGTDAGDEVYTIVFNGLQSSTRSATIDHNWNFYPNPAQKGKNIAIEALPTEGQLRIALYDLMGREVAVLYEGKAENLAQPFAAAVPAQLSAGMYSLALQHNDKMLKNKILTIR